MLISETINSRYYFHSYEDNHICLIDTQSNASKLYFEHSFYIQSNQIIEHPDLADINHLDIDLLRALQGIDILLIGTGSKQYFPSADLYKQILQLDFSVDFMANDAACRTFNILVNESRNVGAFILIDESS